MIGRLLRIMALVAIGSAALWAATFGSFEQEIRQSVAGGYPLPDFRLPELDQGYFNGDTLFIGSEDLEGKVALIAWWATWCGPCIDEQPSLLALQEEFGEAGLVVLGVLHRDSPERAWRWLQEHDRTTFRTVVGTPTLAREARVGGLPNTVLVDRAGTVTELFLGYWPERDAYLRAAVERLVESR